ncbi:MAG: ABC transporter ATP-binding protein [Alphaproteobacteria bacterium]|nr:ABC transporter ATP-binding protein [Alphaproteobacteria bacterium]
MSSSPRLGLYPAVRRLARDYLKPHTRLLALACLAMLVAAGGTAALAWLLSPAIKLIFLEKQQHWLLLLPLIVAAVAILAAVASYTANAILAITGQRVVASLQGRMARSLVRSDLATLEADHSAAQAARFTYDATLVRDMVTRGTAGLAKDVPTVLLLIALMFWLDPTLAFIVLIVLPAGAGAMRLLGRRSHDAAAEGMKETGALSAAISEAVTGRRVIKAYGLEDRAAERAEASVARRLATLIAGERAGSATVPVSEALGGVGIAAVLAYAGWQGQKGGLPLNDLMSFIAAALMAFQPMRGLSALTSVIAQGTAALSRIYAAIDAEPAIADASGAVALSLADAAPNAPMIAFDKVAFTYAAGQPVLHDVSFDVRRGETVALVGPSGAGKTTVVNLLLRFYEPAAGRILMGGRDVSEVTIASLRAAMALVTQDPFLFDDTIAANIECGRPGATQEAIESAARAAAAHEFILALPNGYQTRTGEAGARLSGGQRQRIAIARAVLRDAPILLLDEATSALDAENEARVQEALERLMSGRTTLVVAHRLSTILKADRILVFEQGRIVEQGRHADLVAQNGLYARLFRTQFATAEA